MTQSDWIASLALFVSIVVAATQFYQWHVARRQLRIKWYGQDWASHANLEAAITNQCNHKIYIESVWVGTTYRPWFSPLFRKGWAGTSARKIEDDYISKIDAEGLLNPGDILEISWAKRDCDQEITKPSLKFGFLRRDGIWVEHSGNKYEFHERLPCLST